MNIITRYVIYLENLKILTCNVKGYKKINIHFKLITDYCLAMLINLLN